MHNAILSFKLSLTIGFFLLEDPGLLGFSFTKKLLLLDKAQLLCLLFLNETLVLTTVQLLQLPHLTFFFISGVLLGNLSLSLGFLNTLSFTLSLHFLMLFEYSFLD